MRNELNKGLDDVEVLDNDKFEDAYFEQDNMRMMLKEMQKLRHYSAGEVHKVEAFFMG